MNVDRERLKEIFAKAAELAVPERLIYVESVSGSDDVLKSEILSLLSAADEPDNLIETNSLNVSAVIKGDTEAAPQRRFGNYLISREIGHGGMGAVFLAERDDGEFDMQVALKIVRQSIADAATIDRFKRERQILASLNHPNIAKLYDGGISEKGEPFLAMEFVDGNSLIGFADDQKLSVTQRLELFLKVCSAVSFAHRNLVVHRDIKPGNILVNSGGEPKLLDFGLARSFDLDASSTQTGLRAFTPAYASPEQIRGENLTTATDVYSLGVVLYELLTGQKPYKLDGVPIEALASLESHQPSRPSSVPDPDDPFFSNRTLRGDLDNIVLMAIRREPDRRYASVQAFSDDIRSYLAGRPVSARPNTFGYRTTRFIQRNRLSVAAASLILLAIIAGGMISIVQYRRAQRERRKAAEVNIFLQKMLQMGNPQSPSTGRKGYSVTVREMLDQAADRLDSEDLVDQPDIRAELAGTLGSTYLGLGQYEEAKRYALLALKLKSEIYGPDSPETLVAKLDLGNVAFATSDYDTAEPLWGGSLVEARQAVSNGQLPVDVYANMLTNYGLLKRALGDSQKAEELFAESLALGLPDDKTTTTRTYVALTQFDQGKLTEAESAVRAIYSNASELSPQSLSTANSSTLLGSILMEKGDLADASEQLRKGESIYTKLLSPTNMQIADNIRLQAQVAYLQGEYSVAASQIEKVLAIYRENANPKYISYATALTVRGLTLNKLAKRDEAEASLREALDLRHANLPAGHFMTALTEGALGEVLMDEKKFDDAEPLLRSSLASLEVSQKAENPRLATARSRLERLTALHAAHQ